MAAQPGRRRARRKLPWQQFTILSMVRFAEPIAMTSVFPYLPSMIQSFPGVKPSDVGFWTGVAAAIFSLAQCLTAISWGRASDKYGRKPIILLGLFCTMCTSLLWGFSTSLPMALLARALQGAGNGNVGILRTVVAEICPWKELQPRAFSIMPMVYSLGSIIGPMIGTFANPLNRQASDSSNKHSSLFWKYPWALPNLICAGVFLIGITVGMLFLNESLEAKKERRDLGLVLGRKMTGSLNYIFARIRQTLSGQAGYTPLASSADTSRRKNRKDIESAVLKPRIVEGPPSYSSVLTGQTVLYLAVYTALAMHNTGFDQMISVLMHHPRSGPLVGETRLPFKFSKGFGMDTQRVGFLFTINGCVGTIVQFFIFPTIARKLGTLNCLRVVLHLQTLVYIAVPYTTLITGERLAMTAFCCVWIVKSACSIMAFPCCIILLTNSAMSLRTLATVNGVATSVSAIGRAAGPSITGAAFTWGVKSGYLIAPFVALVIMSFVAFLPLWFAAEDAGSRRSSDEDRDDHAEHCDGHDEDEDERHSDIARDEKTFLMGSLRSSQDSSSSAASSSSASAEPIVEPTENVQVSTAQVAPDVQFLTEEDNLVVLTAKEKITASS